MQQPEYFLEKATIITLQCELLKKNIFKSIHIFLSNVAFT